MASDSHIAFLRIGGSAIGISFALGVLLTLFIVQPARAVTINTNVTCNGEPVPSATVRLETIEGKPIKLTAVKTPQKEVKTPQKEDEKDASTAPPETAVLLEKKLVDRIKKPERTGKADEEQQDKIKKAEEGQKEEQKLVKEQTDGARKDTEEKSEPTLALLTDKYGKLAVELDDHFKNKTVLIVVEKDGQILMKKTVELTADVNQISIGVPAEKLAKLLQETLKSQEGETEPKTGPTKSIEAETAAPPPRITPMSETVDLAVAIGRSGKCRRGGTCCYRIRLTNRGPGVWNGSIGLEDQASFAPDAFDIKQKRSHWACGRAGRDTTCISTPLTLAKGQSHTLEQCVQLPRRLSATVRKCFRIVWPGDSKADNRRDVLRMVQVALGREGYDPGPPDGIVGPRTAQSISDFRSAKSLAPGEGVDRDLLAALFGATSAREHDASGANDSACDEFNLPRAQKERPSAKKERQRRSRPRVVDEEPPPERAPDITPLIDLGIGIGLQHLHRRGGHHREERDDDRD